MKNKIMRFISINLLLFTLCSNAYAARIPVGPTGTQKDIAYFANADPLPLANGQTAGVYFKTDMRLQEVSVICPSMGDSIGSLTLRLYQWKGTYEATVSEKPLGERTYIDFKDCATLKVAPPSGSTVYTGEFLVTVGDCVQNCAVWIEKHSSVISSDMPYQPYFNGKPYDRAIQARCIVSPVTAANEDAPDIAEKDAYTRLYADGADKYSKCTHRMADDNGTQAPYVKDLDTGSYVYYGKVNFGDVSPKGIRMRIYNMGCYSNVGETQVVLDDVQNYPIAKTTVYLDNTEYEWETVTCPITEKITGVHDVYLVFRGKQFGPSWFEFTKETPEKSKAQLVLDEFKATPASAPVERYEDTWVASDILGRKLPDNNDVGDPREGKYVGLFYHTWRSVYGKSQNYPYDVTKIINAYDGDPNDIKNNLAYPYWGPTSSLHFFNESVYGYYTGYDDWARRKQLELFSAADVDALIFDNTNGAFTFFEGYMTFARLIHEMRVEGVDTPQLSFITPFTSSNYTDSTIRTYYDNVYSQGLYSDAWFYWNGKPLVMGHDDIFKTETGYDDIDKQNKEIMDFFTFRPAQGNYWYGPAYDTQWPWLEAAPQHGFGKKTDGSYEAVAVGTAQNTNNTTAKGTYGAMNGEGNFGRSYTHTNGHLFLDETSCYYGYNFQEQWDNALKIDPQFIFITGWNEAYATRFEKHAGVVNAFVDGYDNENSRDIEPLKSDFKDNYYLQMVKNIRKFKGVQKTPEAGKKTTIDVKGDFSQWNNIDLTYYDYKGLVTRDDLMMGETERYVNNTARNDIVTAKVARDDNNIYFYVETADNLTPCTDNAWMRLFINTDRLYATGWEGYDFALNITPATADKLTLSKSVGFWKWEDIATVDYKVQGNKLMLAVSKNDLGLAGKTNLDFEFKWADNMQTYGNLMEDFYTNGDAAPEGRFNYRFVENAKSTKTNDIEEFILPENNLFDKMRHFTVLKIDDPIALYNGSPVAIDKNNSAVTPIVVNDRTFVPLRFVTERLGASSIEWNDETKTATIFYYQKRIMVTEGSNIIKVEKEKKEMDVSAFTLNDRMYVPLRAVSEAFGNVQIHWEDPCYVYIGNKYTDDYKDDPDVKWLMSKYFG